MKQKFWMLAALLLVAACAGPQFNTQDADIKKGNFYVTGIEIGADYGFPGDRYLALEKFKPYLQEGIDEWMKRQEHKPGARNMVLVVKVSQLSVKLSSYDALMVGTQQSVTSKIYLKDAQTGAELGSQTVTNKGGDHTGIAGMLSSSMVSEEWYMKTLASSHGRDIALIALAAQDQ